MEIIDQIITLKAELFDIIMKLENIIMLRNQKIQELRELEKNEEKTRRIA